MILSDHEIRQRCVGLLPMISPYFSESIREASGHKIISFGQSSYGYDVRCADEFRVFSNANGAGLIDPKAFDERSFVTHRGASCIIPPNSFALARTVEYFRIPRDVLTICLGKSTYARCFTGDTRVALADGTSPTFEEMVKRASRNEQLWGYGVHSETGEYMLTELLHPRIIGREPVIEIELDNGQFIKCTKDHGFLRHSGDYTEAQHLRPGDGIVPLYRSVTRGYEAVWIPALKAWMPTHWLADNWNQRHGVYESGTKEHRHRADGNRRNNLPNNIQRIDASEHIRIHNIERQSGKAVHKAFKEWIATEDGAKAFSIRQSERTKAFWGDPEYADARLKRKANAIASWTPERRQAAAERMRTNNPRGKNHKVVSIRDVPGEHDVFCVTAPDTGNFALDAGVIAKNCGIIVNVTPLEPEWEGHVTMEFSNTTTLPVRIYAGEGCAQFLFLRASAVCDTSYADRGGKYQGQTGVTLPRM